MVLRLAAAEVAGAYAEGKNHDEAESSTARKTSAQPTAGWSGAAVPGWTEAATSPGSRTPLSRAHPASWNCSGSRPRPVGARAEGAPRWPVADVLSPGLRRRGHAARRRASDERPRPRHRQGDRHPAGAAAVSDRRGLAPARSIVAVGRLDEGSPMIDLTAAHEASHCVAAWAFGTPIAYAAIGGSRSRAGEVWTRGLARDPMSGVVILLAGWMGAAIAAGEPPRTDWTMPDPDTVEALSLLDRMRRPWVARDVADLRTRSLLTTRWRAVEVIADELLRRGTISGRRVDQLCRTADVLKVGERRRKAVDPDRIFTTVEGKRLSMREWADIVAMSGHDVGRARRAVREGGRK